MPRKDRTPRKDRWIVRLSCGHSVVVFEIAYVPKTGSHDRCPACNALVTVQGSHKAK